MSNLRKMTNPNLTQEEQEAILDRAIQSKFDRELRADWEAKLRAEHGVFKGGSIIRLRGRRNFFLTVGAIAAALLLALIAFNPFSPSGGAQAKDLAMNYLEQADKFHYGATKGETSDEEDRIAAIQAYNEQRYPEALRSFSQIEEQTPEDAYYSAMASLFNADWDEAIVKYERLLRTESPYLAQANWYRIIALVMKGEEMQARQFLLQYSPADSDFYAKAQELLKAIE